MPWNFSSGNGPEWQSRQSPTCRLPTMLRPRVASPRAAVPWLAAGAFAMMVVIQVAYFHVGDISPRTRFIVVAALFLAAIASGPRTAGH